MGAALDAVIATFIQQSIKTGRQDNIALMRPLQDLVDALEDLEAGSVSLPLQPKKFRGRSPLTTATSRSNLPDTTLAD